MERIYYKKDFISALRGFCAVVRAQGNMSEAARNLYISPGAINQQVAAVERLVGHKCFDRTKKVLVVNKVGKITYTKAVKILGEVDGLFKAINAEVSTEEADKIVIACHHIAVSRLLPQIILQYEQNSPVLSPIHIYDDVSREEAINLLITEKVDILLYPSLETQAEYFFYPIDSFDPMLIMRKDHPLATKEEITPENIAEHRLIFINERLISLPTFNDFAKSHHWGGNITFEHGDWEKLIHFVKAGIGLAVVSSICIDPNDPSIICKNLSKLFPRMRYDLAVKRGKYLNKSVQQFIRTISPSFFQHYENQ